MSDAVTTTALLPPAEQPDRVGRRVFELLEAVVRDKARLGLHEKWTRHYRLGQNRAWRGLAQPGVPLVSANLLHLHRQRTVNMLTDNHPTFNVNRVGPTGDEDLFRALERAAAWWWTEQEQQAVLERSVLNGETYGLAVEKVVFDPDLEYGLGEVRTVVVDPFAFGVYPTACPDIQDAEAVLHFTPMTLREAARRWPEAAGRLTSDAALLADLGDGRREAATGDGTRRGLFARFGEVVRTLAGAGQTDGPSEDTTLVCECWVKDYAMTPDGPRYPGCIRCVTVAGAGGLVLADRGNPSVNPALTPDEAMATYLYDRFPFALANSLTDPASLWGASDFEQLSELQTEVNKCLSQLTYHKDRCARPKIINPRDSGVANAAFTNRLGIVNPASMAAAQGIRYLEFANNTKDIESVLAIYRELFSQISGLGELERAGSPDHPVIAYKAISALIEQAATLLRGKIRNYSRLVRERGRMFLSHMQNWYTEERWISFAENGRASVAPISGTKCRVPARLTVVSGSTMPVSRVQQREEALALYQMGAIDRRDLLEKLDWSGRAAVLERMGEEKNRGDAVPSGSPAGGDHPPRTPRTGEGRGGGGSFPAAEIGTKEKGAGHAAL
uniref:Phage portal protein n=1 Tax=Desulfovibrio sp. U5L TaxID=596152 RepID=I2PYM7_9BACT